MDNLLKNIEDLDSRVKKTWELLDLDSVFDKVREQKKKTADPDFWQNQAAAVELSRNLEENERELATWNGLKNEIRDLHDLTTAAEEEGEMAMQKDLESKYAELEEKFKKLEFYILFAGSHDAGNVILSIHAGTGGVDAQDWAEILERMFFRFAEKKGWKTDLLEKTYGNEAGIKSLSVKFSGKWAYGYLRGESGVHRLVRISPFDSEAMRHTSFALVEVIPELPEAEEIEIRDCDLKIDVYRSSGPGGQSVNTTDSAVRITHLPTGIKVACQNERSQHQNKETAMKVLKSKLFKLQTEEREKEEAKIKGVAQKAEWGNQIRSYVMQPYKMVKDHRTACETQEIDRVLDGDLDEFAEAYLKWDKSQLI